MSLLRTQSLVLRTYPLGETSLIAVLVSREEGLLRAVAKGARDPKSRFRGLLEPGTPLDVLLYLKSNSDLHLLKEISLRGGLPRASRDLEHLSLRLAALELVMMSSQSGEAVAGLFELLEEYLSLFQAGEGVGPAPFFAFEAALLVLHGVGLDLDRCCRCEGPLDREALRFLPGEGLFACRRCGAEGIDLARDEVDWLESVFFSRPSELRDRILPSGARRQIGRVLHLALSRHLPGYRLPRSLAMLRSLRPPEDEREQE